MLPAILHQEYTDSPRAAYRKAKSCDAPAPAPGCFHCAFPFHVQMQVTYFPSVATSPHKLTRSSFEHTFLPRDGSIKKDLGCSSQQASNMAPNKSSCSCVDTSALPENIIRRTLSRNLWERYCSYPLTELAVSCYVLVCSTLSRQKKTNCILHCQSYKSMIRFTYYSIN